MQTWNTWNEKKTYQLCNTRSIYWFYTNLTTKRAYICSDNNGHHLQYMVYIERKYEITWFMCSRVKWISLYIFVYCKHDLVLFIGGIYGAPLSWLDLNSNTKTRLLHNNEVNIYCSFSKYTYQSSFDWLLNWLVILVLEFTMIKVPFLVLKKGEQ